MEILKEILIFLIALPVEVLFLVISMCYAKGIKEKRILFYTLVLASSVIFLMVVRYELWGYIAFIASSFFIMRVLYKSNIADLFVFITHFIWITITSFISLIITRNIVISYIIQRILLFGLLFICKNKMSKWYKNYCKLWDYTYENQGKSITLRNISLIIVNIFILFLNFFLKFLSKIY